MIKHFTLILKVKDCEKEFKEGLGKGVLVIEDIFFRIKDEDQLKEPMFFKSLIEAQTDLINKYIEVELQEGGLER